MNSRQNARKKTTFLFIFEERHRKQRMRSSYLTQVFTSHWIMRGIINKSAGQRFSRYSSNYIIVWLLLLQVPMILSQIVTALVKTSVGFSNMKRIFENLPEPGRKRKSDLFHLLRLQVFFFFQENLLNLECCLYSHHSFLMQKKSSAESCLFSKSSSRGTFH